MEKYICYLIVFIIEALILLEYASNLFQSKHSRKCEGLFLAFIYIILLFIFIQQNFIINTLTFLLGNFIFFIAMYHIQWFSALFHALITTIALGTGELMVLSIITHFAPDFFAQQTYFRNVVLLSIFSKTIYLFVLYFLSHFYKMKKEKSLPHDKTSLILTFVPASSLCIFYTLCEVCLETKLSLFLDWMISISAILILCINLFIFAVNNYSQRKNMEYTQMQLLLQTESDTSRYYKMLLEQTENRNILIHDIKKHLNSIATLNKQGESEKIDAYIQRIIEFSDLKTSARVCDHDLLNAILGRYITQCQEKGISFTPDIRSGTANFIDTDDLTALFCNLLDNAFESCLSMKHSFMELHMSNKENTKLTLITLTNSCRKSPFLPNSKRLISTKKQPQHHGFGIKSIERVIKKYDGCMEMYYDEETLTFHTIITLIHP